MAKGRKKKSNVIPQATEAMNNFKFEMASELGIHPVYSKGHWENISGGKWESTGGKGVRAKIAEAEQDLNLREGGFKS